MGTSRSTLNDRSNRNRTTTRAKRASSSSSSSSGNISRIPAQSPVSDFRNKNSTSSIDSRRRSTGSNHGIGGQSHSPVNRRAKALVYCTNGTNSTNSSRGSPITAQVGINGNSNSKTSSSSGGSGVAQRGKLDIFKRKRPKGHGRPVSLPVGSGGKSSSSSSSSSSRADRDVRSTGRLFKSAVATRTRSDGQQRAIKSSIMMQTAIRSASSGQPASRCDSDTRQSFRIRRQPSTYGELHELVAQQKLGTGAVRGLGGLQNLGNTCYMNSALQCLFNCEALADYFLGFDWQAEINRANILGHKGLMAEALGSLASEMWSSDKAFLRPNAFKEQVGESMPLFAGYEQQDVQEFLAFLLDAVHEDLNRVPNAERKYVEAKEAKEGEPEELVAMEAWKGYLERNRSIIVDLFQGQLRSALQCGVCGRRSVTFDPFMYLSVPLPVPADPAEDSDVGRQEGGDGGGGDGGGSRGSKRKPPEYGRGGPKFVSLEACIRRFCEEETLEGDNAWYCPSCKKHQPATKKLDLWKVPPVLIVHLKRFAGADKISLPVMYPLEGLDLSEAVKSPQKEAPDYDLYATANHHGVAHGGHYTAVAKNRVSGNWNLFNDERVESLEVGEVQAASAYVLFYTKMSTIEESVPDGTADGRKHEPRPPGNISTTGGGNIVSHEGERLGAGGTSAGSGNLAEAAVESSGGDNRPLSPKRAAAVVRRQSVSKPHNWPHLHEGQFQPSFHPAFQATLPAMQQENATDGGAPNLRRTKAEQGHGGPMRGGSAPQSDGGVLAAGKSEGGVTLPKLSVPSAHAQGGRRAPPSSQAASGAGADSIGQAGDLKRYPS